MIKYCVNYSLNGLLYQTFSYSFNLDDDGFIVLDNDFHIHRDIVSCVVFLHDNGQPF